MPLSEVAVTKAIVDDFLKEISNSLEIDVAVVGAGPSGMTCAYYLAKGGASVTVFERKLNVGGGMWGGGMLFPRIVLQEEALEIPREFGIRLSPCGDGYHVGNSVEMVAKCTSSAVDAGARVWVGVTVEDVMIRENDKVSGVVFNWGAVELAGLHVDPLTVSAKVVIDATGHECAIGRIIERKTGPRLNTETGCVIGEKSMWAEIGEGRIVENTKEVFPGLLVTGMAANAAYGSPRMGAIFGGMLMSGKKAAQTALEMIR